MAANSFDDLNRALGGLDQAPSPTRRARDAGPPRRLSGASLGPPLLPVTGALAPRNRAGTCKKDLILSIFGGGSTKDAASNANANRLYDSPWRGNKDHKMGDVMCTLSHQFAEFVSANRIDDFERVLDDSDVLYVKRGCRNRKGAVNPLAFTRTTTRGFAACQVWYLIHGPKAFPTDASKVKMISQLRGRELEIFRTHGTRYLVLLSTYDDHDGHLKACLADEKFSVNTQDIPQFFRAIREKVAEKGVYDLSFVEAAFDHPHEGMEPFDEYEEPCDLVRGFRMDFYPFLKDYVPMLCTNVQDLLAKDKRKGDNSTEKVWLSERMKGIVWEEQNKRASPTALMQAPSGKRNRPSLEAQNAHPAIYSMGRRQVESGSPALDVRRNGGTSLVSPLLGSGVTSTGMYVTPLRRVGPSPVAVAAADAARVSAAAAAARAAMLRAQLQEGKEEEKEEEEKEESTSQETKSVD